MIKILDAWQQVIRQHGCHRDRNHQRCEGRHDKRNAQGHKQLAFNARQSEQGDEHQHNNHRGVHNTCSYFKRCLAHKAHQVESNTRVFRPLFLQTAKNIFYVYHGIIDQTTNGNGQPTQRHGVDGKSKILKHQGGDENRHRDGNQCDHGRANRTQEKKQHCSYKYRSANQLSLQGGN